MFHESKRMNAVRSYAFDEIRKEVSRLRSNGIDVIDMGVGDPVRATPERVRNACHEGIERFAQSGYPPYQGMIELRQEAQAWMKRKYGIDVDAEREIIVTIGSKEAIFHLPMGLLDPGDIALIPSPGYPPYTSGTIFAGGKPLYYPLTKENGFLPDLEYISKLLETQKEDGRIKLMWICYPNAPTGKVASVGHYRELISLLRSHGVILASDEAYADFVYSGSFVSPLQVSKEGVVSFFSLSKRSNMTGYRVGWVAGDSRIISLILQIKTSADSGTPWFIQQAAMEALRDEESVDKMRNEYRLIRDMLVDTLTSVGLEECRPEGALYIWQKVPDGMSAREFASRLLRPEIAVVCIPGDMLASSFDDGSNPGQGYVRFSLTCLPERVKEACKRIKENKAEIFKSQKRIRG